jgi:hypothetical protein
VGGGAIQLRTSGEARIEIAADDVTQRERWLIDLRSLLHDLASLAGSATLGATQVDVMK